MTKQHCAMFLVSKNYCSKPRFAASIYCKQHAGTNYTVHRCIISGYEITISLKKDVDIWVGDYSAHFSESDFALLQETVSKIYNRIDEGEFK